MQSLPEWLDVPTSTRKELYAVALLERTLPLQRSTTLGKQTRPAPQIGENAAFALLALQSCPQPRQALYVAQLLHALELPALTLRQLHRVMATGTSAAAGNNAHLALQVRCWHARL